MFFYYFPDTNNLDSLFKMSRFDIEEPKLRKRLIGKDPDYINLQNSNNYWAFYFNLNSNINHDSLLNDILNMINNNISFDYYIFHIRVYNNNHQIIYPLESSDKDIELFYSLYNKYLEYIKSFTTSHI